MVGLKFIDILLFANLAHNPGRRDRKGPFASSDRASCACLRVHARGVALAILIG
ncbi:MAG: hypothetical protein ACR2KH_07660 [Sphingomicrobium sp.]